MDRIEAMRVFSEVAAHKSFTTAASNLSLSKSKVTRYIRELEDWLGCRLLQRTTRNMSLTLAGEESLSKIKEIIEASEKLQLSLSQQCEKPKGLLRVSANAYFGELVLSNAISEYLLEYPDVRIELIIDEKYLNLVDCRIDLAFRSSLASDTSLIARPIIKEKTVICASPIYLRKHGPPFTPDELRSHKTLLCSTFKNFNQWYFKKRDRTVETNLESTFYSNDIRVLTKAALAGTGITKLPQQLAIPLIKEGKLCQLLSDWETLDISIWAVYVCRDHQPATVRTFIDFMVSYTQKKQVWNGTQKTK